MIDLYQGMLLNNEIWKYGNQEYHYYSQEYFGVDTWSFVDVPPHYRFSWKFAIVCEIIGSWNKVW